ncbi:MAG TPA: SpoIID/LytB domain-containing protein [Coleofasciculaceae cyanobacterium]
MTSAHFPSFFLTRLARLQHLRHSIWWLAGLLWFIMIAPAQAALELRVGIQSGSEQVKVGSSTKAVVRDGTGRPLGEIAAMNAFMAKSDQGKVVLDRWQSGQIWVEPAAGGYVFIGDRWYRGRALVIPTSKGLTAVNYVDLEHYLYSVLGGEMSGTWPQEALKAQAVAARSYALYSRQRAANAPFDLGDTAAWQVYRGISDESVGTQAAVNATRDQVLTYQGQIIEAVFHSSAGGCTENVEDVWVQPLPYLRSVKEPFTEKSPVAQWTQTFSQSELSNLIADVGTVLSLQPEKTTACGRVVSMRVEGDKGRRVISGDTLREALNLKSTLFVITPQTATTASKSVTASASVLFQVSGRGFGHGLGLSQWGAHNLANQGATYQQILMFYYTNTQLAKIQVK